MPELFPNLPTYVFCALVMAGAQLLYATVGFGAGMFSIAIQPYPAHERSIPNRKPNAAPMIPPVVP